MAYPFNTKHAFKFVLIASCLFSSTGQASSSGGSSQASSSNSFVRSLAVASNAQASRTLFIGFGEKNETAQYMVCENGQRPEILNHKCTQVTGRFSLALTSEIAQFEKAIGERMSETPSIYGVMVAIGMPVGLISGLGFYHSFITALELKSAGLSEYFYSGSTYSIQRSQSLDLEKQAKSNMGKAKIRMVGLGALTIIGFVVSALAYNDSEIEKQRQLQALDEMGRTPITNALKAHDKTLTDEKATKLANDLFDVYLNSVQQGFQSVFGA